MCDLAAALAAALSLVACGGYGFPEDQRIEGPFRITTEWQTIEFDRPLEINRDGLQRLHLVVDAERYHPNSLYDLEDVPNQANLRRSDGTLVKPQVTLVGAQGQEVKVYARANTNLYSGGLTIGFSMFEDHYSPAPDYPPEIRAFKAVRIRSNVPFEVQYLRWHMDVHPDPRRCGGRKCSWLQRVSVMGLRAALAQA